MTVSTNTEITKGIAMARAFFAIAEDRKKKGLDAEANLILMFMVKLPMSAFISLAEAYERQGGG